MIEGILRDTDRNTWYSVLIQTGRDALCPGNADETSVPVLSVKKHNLLHLPMNSRRFGNTLKYCGGDVGVLWILGYFDRLGI